MPSAHRKSSAGLGHDDFPIGVDGIPTCTWQSVRERPARAAQPRRLSGALMVLSSTGLFDGGFDEAVMTHPSVPA